MGKSISTNKKSKKKQSISKRIARIIFGKNPAFISKPINLFAKNPETFWVLDQGNGKIFQIQNNSFETPRFLRKGFEEYNSLVGICSMNNNKILFTDSYLQTIFLIDLNNKKIHPLNDSLSLVRPTGIAYSEINNEIWVVETGEHRIKVLDNKGEVKKIIGKRGNGNGEFNFPTFICKGRTINLLSINI